MTTAHDADATIQFRMNSTIKEGAFAVLREMGISPSVYVLRAVVGASIGILHRVG